MLSRRTATTLVALALAGTTGFAASAALAPGEVRVPTPVERVHRYYPAGPSATYSGDAGGIGSVEPLTWATSGNGARSAVVEASFQYRTKGDGPFVINLGVIEVGGPAATVRPQQLTLAPASEGSTTTVRFLVPDLVAGRDYAAYVGVNSQFAGRGTNRVDTHKLLLTVELGDG